LKTDRSTIEQLRSDIDQGRTGDKVEGADPAAAPLGADEEAAGTKLHSSIVSAARNVERRRGPNRPRKKSGVGAGWILISFVVVLASGILSLAFFL
jgi:hypothetical protein